MNAKWVRRDDRDRRSRLYIVPVRRIQDDFRRDFRCGFFAGSGVLLLFGFNVLCTDSSKTSMAKGFLK